MVLVLMIFFTGLLVRFLVNTKKKSEFITPRNYQLIFQLMRFIKSGSKKINFR